MDLYFKTRVLKGDGQSIFEYCQFNEIDGTISHPTSSKSQYKEGFMEPHL